MNVFRVFSATTAGLRNVLLSLQVLCLIGLATPVWAQEPPLTLPLDEPQACLQYAEFQQQRRLVGLPKPLVSSGRILLDCERGTLWNTTVPIHETVVYTFSGKHWLIKASGAEQEIKNSVQKRIGDILSRLVRGDRAFIDKYFHREPSGNITRLLPTQRRLKKYIENIDLEPTPDGLRVSVVRTDQQNMIIDISSLRALSSLDVDSCNSLLGTEQGCARLFAINGR